MALEKSIRAFLAIDPPEEVLREIAGIQERLKRTIQEDIRWVRPEGIHLTLKFFGSISADKIDGITRVIDEHVTAFTPLDLTIRRIGVFPDLKRPRVVWLGTEGDIEQLIALQRKLDEGFQGLGFEREDRPFRAHLTLGRIKTPKEVAGLAKALESGRDATAGQFRAGSLCLFRSELKPSGAVYTKLAEFPFRG